MRETMPRDWWVGPLYITLAFPLGVLSWLLDSLAEILQVLSNTIDTVQRKWLHTTRRWTGRTPQGLTPRVVAEREAKREAALNAMRAPFELKPLFRTPEERPDEQ